MDFLIANQQHGHENQSNTLYISFKNKLQLDNVSFSYSDSITVFKPMMMNIYRGDFIGLTGFSGSGKSTFLNVVSALLPPSTGTLTIDDQPVTTKNMNAYRFLFSYVNQDVFMLNSSIVSNIAFADKSPNIDKVMACIAQVNLTSWVESLSGVYPYPQLANWEIRSVVDSVSVLLLHGPYIRILRSFCLMKSRIIWMMKVRSKCLKQFNL